MHSKPAMQSFAVWICLKFWSLSFFCTPHGHTWPHMAIHGQGWAVSIQATQTSSRTTLAKVRSSGAELSITGPLQWPQHWTPEMMKRSNLVQGSCWIGVEECNFTWFCIWYPVGSETQCNLRWHCGHKWKEVPVELEAHLQSKPAASPKKELFACHLGWFSSNILPEPEIHSDPDCKWEFRILFDCVLMVVCSTNGWREHVSLPSFFPCFPSILCVFSWIVPCYGKPSDRVSVHWSPVSGIAGREISLSRAFLYMWVQ